MKFLDTLIHTTLQILKIGISCKILHKIFNERNVHFSKDDFFKEKAQVWDQKLVCKGAQCLQLHFLKEAKSKVDDNTQTLVPRPKTCR